MTALIADCALAAIDKLTPAELPWDEASFNALYEQVRAELIDTVFTVTAVVERILASTRRIEKQLKGTTSLALISALNDVKSQLEQLVFPGFVARTGYAQLSQLPRYLAAIEKRLEKLPGNVQRDALHMAAVQALEDDYDDAVSALLPGPAGRRRVNPGALDDRGAPGEPLRRRTRNRLFGLREADPRGAEQGAGAGVAPGQPASGRAGTACQARDVPVPASRRPSRSFSALASSRAGSGLLVRRAEIKVRHGVGRPHVDVQVVDLVAGHDQARPGRRRTRPPGRRRSCGPPP